MVLSSPFLWSLGSAYKPHLKRTLKFAIQVLLFARRTAVVRASVSFRRFSLVSVIQSLGGDHSGPKSPGCIIAKLFFTKFSQETSPNFKLKTLIKENFHTSAWKASSLTLITSSNIWLKGTWKETREQTQKIILRCLYIINTEHDPHRKHSCTL